MRGRTLSLGTSKVTAKSRRIIGKSSVLELLEKRVLLSGYSINVLDLASGNGSGQEAYSALLADNASNLYGTAEMGGKYGFGEIFEIPAGSSAITTLASFDPASTYPEPRGQLVIDAQGNLYGTTQRGGIDGMGSVFELAAGSSTITTVASFDGTNGQEPVSGLVIDRNGNLFGTTPASVFEIAAGSSTITTLATFNGNNGSGADGQLVLDANGDVFGTTQSGGSSGAGEVFELPAESSTISVLASFSTSFCNSDFGGRGQEGYDIPTSGLAVDGNGNIFGTVAFGGPSDDGGIFEIAANSSTLTPLAYFDSTTGQSPTGQIALDGQDNLFGATVKNGTSSPGGPLFELPAGSSTIQTIVTAGEPLDGDETGVTLGPDGKLYLNDGQPSEVLVWEASLTSFADTLWGTAASDNITLSQDPDQHNIDWSINGGATSLLPIDDPNGLTIWGEPRNDTITLDYTDGNPLPATLHLNGTFTINGLQGTNPLAGKTLEIGGSTVFISYHSADPIAAVRGCLQNGYNAGGWNGTPTATTGVITSAVAQADHKTAIGYADWADGQSINTTPNTIELTYTLYGDANLDGQVNSADLQILLFNLNRRGSWDQGDFNYDDQVNSADLQRLLFTLNTSLGSQVTPLTVAAAPAAKTTSASSSSTDPSPNLLPAVNATGLATPLSAHLHPAKVVARKRQ